MSKKLKNKLYSIVAGLCSFVLAGTLALTLLKSNEQAWGATIQQEVSGRDVVKHAFSYLGVKYHAYTDEEINKYGASVSRGFDCSSWVRQVFTDLGFRQDSSYTLPTGPWSWAGLKSFMYGGKNYTIEEVPVNDPSKWQAGDVMFFGTASNPYTHMGIYVGEYGNKDDLIKDWNLTNEQAGYILGDSSGGTRYWRINCMGNATVSDRSFPYGVRIDNQTTDKQRGGTVTKLIRLTHTADKTYKFGKINFIKTGEISGVSIADANWRLYSSKEQAEKAFDERNAGLDTVPYVTSFTTDKDGHTSFEVADGTYYAVEWETKTGSSLEDTIYEVFVNENTKQKLTNKEWKNTVVITKVDSLESNKKLTGAEFTIYEYNRYTEQFVESGKMTDNGDGTYLVGSITVHDRDGNVVKTIDDGYLYYTDVNIGGYMIKETKNPEGYTGDYTNYLQITKENNGQTLTWTVENSPKPGYIRLIKRNAYDTEELLAGAHVDVYRDSACTDLVGQIITDENGQGYIKETDEAGTTVLGNLALEPGTYYLKESSAPEGYMLNQNVYPVAVGKTETVEITIYDAPKPGVIHLYKFDDDAVIRDENGNITGGTPLSGAVYGVYTDRECRNAAEYVEYSADGTKILDTGIEAVLTTDSEGKAVSAYLPAGIYYLKELSAPEGYDVSDVITKVDLRRNKFESIKLTDKIKAASITIIKDDALTGVSSQGSGSFEGAQFGLYAAEDIIFATTGEAVYPKGSKISLTTAADGSYVYVTDESQPSVNPTTNADGKAVIKGLLPGKYYIKEIMAPSGYRLDKNVRLNVDLMGAAPVVTRTYEDNSKPMEYEDMTGCSSDNVVVYFHDEVLTCDIEILKFSSADGLAVKDVGFMAYPLEAVLAANGISEIPKDKDGNLDITGLNLVGLEIAGNEGRVAYTDAGGCARFEGVAYGRYLVVEVSAPAKYKLAPPQITAAGPDILVEGPNYSEVKKLGKTTLVFINDEAMYDLTIDKYVFEKDYLVHPKFEASFELYDAEGNRVADFTTEKGLYTITGLRGGNYVLKETKVPAGYHMLDEEIDIVLSATESYMIIDGTKHPLLKKGESALFEAFTDTGNEQYVAPVPNTENQLTVKKVDEKGAFLAGAELGLYKASADGKIYDTASEWVTDGKTKIFEALAPGWYVLRENKAPEGYQKADDILFEITSKDSAKEITMTDYPEDIEIPEPTEPETAPPVQPTRETGSLQVIVLEEGTNKEIEGAAVKIDGADTGTFTLTTNEKGETIITDGLTIGEIYKAVLTDPTTGYEAVPGKEKGEHDITTARPDKIYLYVRKCPETHDEPTGGSEPITEPETLPPPEKEPDFTYDPIPTGDKDIVKEVMLMMISGAGLVTSVVLLVLNNRKKEDYAE